MLHPAAFLEESMGEEGEAQIALCSSNSQVVNNHSVAIRSSCRLEQSCGYSTMCVMGEQQTSLRKKEL